MRKPGVMAIILLLASVVVPAAYAGTATFTLKRASLTNVDDAAGRWQFEGGTVWRGTVQVGHYAASRRVVTGGTDAMNTSMYTLTLFFSGKEGSRNVTLQGQWNFGPGTATGGVSAASAPYQFLQHDGVFSVAGASTLTINWTGGGALP